MVPFVCCQPQLTIISAIITLCLCKACCEFSQIANSNTASFAPNVLNSGVPEPKFIFLGLLHSFSSHLAFLSRDSARLTLTNGSFLMRLFSEGREIFWRTSKGADLLIPIRLVGPLWLVLMQVRLGLNLK